MSCFETGCEGIQLYRGITLSYIRVTPGHALLPREAGAHMIQINYCRAGRAAWEGPDGSVFLNPGDFSIHGPGDGPDGGFSFPAGQYQGLLIQIDREEAAAHPPEALSGTGVLHRVLGEKFGRQGLVTFLAGDDRSEGIFSGFYGQPEELARPYQQLKTLELLLYLAKLGLACQNRLAQHPAGQVEIVRAIHDGLLQRMDRRVTIEELARQYLINPTTLKAVFKAVYGESLAAHIKAHRMEQAARLLRGSDMTIAEVAAAVGYESQSKFTAAFKNQFAVAPRAYRKQG